MGLKRQGFQRQDVAPRLVKSNGAGDKFFQGGKLGVAARLGCNSAVSGHDLFLIHQYGYRNLADRPRSLDDLPGGLGDLVIDPLLLFRSLALVAARSAGSAIWQVRRDRDRAVTAVGGAGFILGFGRDHDATLRIERAFIDLFAVGDDIDADFDDGIAGTDPRGQKVFNILANLVRLEIARGGRGGIVAVRGNQPGHGVDDGDIVGLHS